jgi:hypothetical protein
MKLGMDVFPLKFCPIVGYVNSLTRALRENLIDFQLLKYFSAF